MNYILKKNGIYYFNRRVPDFLRSFDPRKQVRVSLFTDSRKEALKLVVRHNENLEEYWRQLAKGQSFSNESFKAASRKSRLEAFIGDNEKPVEVVASAAPLPAPVKPKEATAPTIEKGLTLFWAYARNKTMNKSPNQLRKWSNQRKLAIRNLIKCIGNKPMTEVTRADLLKFRDWWIDRMQEENLGPNAANKNLIQTKTIFETVNENLNLGIDTPMLFKKLLLEENWETTRRPFETDYIRNVLLNPKNLAELPEQLRCMLYAVAETGAGLAEQVGLLLEDIHLDCDIPYIEIVPRQKKALKTRYRKRSIPLVGYALEAFKMYPQGFADFRDRPDGLSARINKYLREHNLLPTDKHSIYSLRHSFQDRLLAVNAPDRVQADLMGHKFNRPAYGEGATLQQKLEWLKKIRLK